MAIFELDGAGPDLPRDGRYWIAESAIVIGRVRLKTDASVWFGSVLRGDSQTQVQRVHTDTRTLQPGDLFVALKGDQFDANDFIAEALNKGASEPPAMSLSSEALPAVMVAIINPSAIAIRFICVP